MVLFASVTWYQAQSLRIWQFAAGIYFEMQLPLKIMCFKQKIDRFLKRERKKEGRGESVWEL